MSGLASDQARDPHLTRTSEGSSRDNGDQQGNRAETRLFKSRGNWNKKLLQKRNTGLGLPSIDHIQSSESLLSCSSGGSIKRTDGLIAGKSRSESFRTYHKSPNAVIHNQEPFQNTTLGHKRSTVQVKAGSSLIGESPGAFRLDHSPGYKPSLPDHTSAGRTPTEGQTQPMSWLSHNREVLQLSGPSQRTSPRLTRKAEMSAVALKNGMATSKGMNEPSFDKKDKNSFPVIKFRSYNKSQGAKQHRTLTFNLDTVRPFPVSDRTISPISLPYSVQERANTRGDEKTDFQTRKGKGSVSNELWNFKQLRTSTPKPEIRPKRRKVEFRDDSPEIGDLGQKERVSTMSERLDITRYPLNGSTPTPEPRHPPKSILKNKDTSPTLPPGEMKHSRTYPSLLWPPQNTNSLALPSIKRGSSSSLAYTKQVAAPNMRFTCSKEFAAVFEDLDDDF